MEENNEKRKYTKKQWVMFISGLLAMAVGAGILGFFGVRKIWRELRKQKLMRENCVLEIPSLGIKAPVLEGTENEILAKAVGHFPGTGTTGSGNYCIAGHSSVLYKEYFNALKDIQQGAEMLLYDIDKNCYTYEMTDMFIVEPNETWILGDFADNRLTLVTCTDDGSQRRIVVGKLAETQQSAP